VRITSDDFSQPVSQYFAPRQPFRTQTRFDINRWCYEVTTGAFFGVTKVGKYKYFT